MIATSTLPTPAATPVTQARRPLPPAPRPERYDIYKCIHKALRRQMSEALLHIGQVDVADASDFAAALGRIEDLCGVLRGHVAHENQHLQPALEAAEQGASRRTTLEHDQHLIDLAAIEAETQALRDAAPMAREAIALQLYRHLALFVAENFEHMHIEETAHNAVLWAHYSDAQILAIEGRILASMSPQDNLASLCAIARAISVQELIALLSGMQAEAPPEAFRMVLDALAPQQDPQRWLYVLQSLAVAGQSNRPHA